MDDLAASFGAIKIECTSEQLHEFIRAVQKLERLAACEEIKKEDQQYKRTMKSSDCIKVILGEWQLHILDKFDN